MENLRYKESQINRHIFVIVVGILVSILFGILAALQFFLNIKIGNHPAPTWGLMIVSLSSLLGLIVFSSQRLEILIFEDKVCISFGIFSRRKNYPIEDIKSLRVRKYDGMKEFYGWGVRSNSKEKCFTVAGDYGVELTFQDGKQVLVGTQNVEKISESLAYFNVLYKGKS